MEILFIFISLLLAIGCSYAMGRLVHSHYNLLRALKEDEHLLCFILYSTLISASLSFAVLCAFNNSIWHLPYYFK